MKMQDDQDFNGNEGIGKINPDNSELNDELSRQYPSILVSKAAKDNKASLKSRKDSYGVLIRHQAKKHKIKFRNDISEVKIVENWKEFNMDEKPCCSCNLF